MLITEQLHQLSLNEAWQEMNERVQDRQVQLDLFFASPVSEKETEIIATGIKKILESDEKLKQHPVQQKQQVTKSLKALSTGKRAIKAYNGSR